MYIPSDYQVFEDFYGCFKLVLWRAITPIFIHPLLSKIFPFQLTSEERSHCIFFYRFLSGRFVCFFPLRVSWNTLTVLCFFFFDFFPLVFLRCMYVHFGCIRCYLIDSVACECVGVGASTKSHFIFIIRADGRSSSAVNKTNIRSRFTLIKNTHTFHSSPLPRACCEFKDETKSGKRKKNENQNESKQKRGIIDEDEYNEDTERRETHKEKSTNNAENIAPYRRQNKQ